MLDTSPTAVKGVLQRGRSALARQHTGTSHESAVGGGSVTEHDLASRFSAAFTAGDVDSVVALLTDDAWLAMPPAPHEYVGGAAIASFLRASTEWRERRRLRLVPTRANRQPAFAVLPQPPRRAHRVPHGNPRPRRDQRPDQHHHALPRPRPTPTVRASRHDHRQCGAIGCVAAGWAPAAASGSASPAIRPQPALAEYTGVPLNGLASRAGWR